MKIPVISSGSEETWAPSGMTFLNNNLYFGGLRGSTLYKARLNDERISSIDKLLANEYGRIRIVAKDSLGNLYIGTSNKDGRGTIRQNDDKIIQISPDKIDL
jgi:hypothetical protein